MWIEVIFAVRSGARGGAFLGLDLAGVNTKRGERALEWGKQARGAGVWPCFRVY